MHARGLHRRRIGNRVRGVAVGIARMAAANREGTAAGVKSRPCSATTRSLTMTSLPPCPKCSSAYVYEDGASYVCPECGHEWPQVEAAEEAKVVKDAVGNVLQDGDTVTVIKDLKLKDDTLTFSVVRKIMENEITVEYKLKIDGEKLKGKGAAEFGGEKREFDIEAKKQKTEKS